METKTNKILMINNEPDSLIIKQLINEGFPEAMVCIAVDSRNGLDIVSFENPHVIIIDTTMTELDGFEVCRNIKADKQLSGIPVLLLTALTDKPDHLQAFECGADGFLYKPVKKCELFVQIRTMLKLSELNIQRHCKKHNHQASYLGKNNTHKKVLSNQRDKQIGFIGLTQDIPEHKNAEDALKLFEYIYDNLPVGISITLPSSEIRVNKTMCEMLGYSAGELEGKTWLHISHPDDIMLSQREIYSLVSCEKERIRFEKRYLKKDGSIIWVDILASARRDAEGKLVYFITSIIDITERKLAEDAKKESEEKYRLLFETMAHGVVHQEADGTIISANPAAERILGVTFEQMQGKTSYYPGWKSIREDGSILHGSEHPAMIALHTGKAVGPIILGIYQPKLNNHVWLSVNAIPLFQPGQRTPYQVYAIFEDITEVRKAKQNYEYLFREMVNAFALHEIICDSHGKPVDYRFIAVNPSFEKMIGVKAKDIVNKTVLELWPETEPYWIETYGHVALSGKPAFFENYAVSLDKYFEVSAYQPVPNQFACTFFDVTKRKQAEFALKQSQAILQAALENSPAGIAIADAPDGKLRYVNKAGLLIRNKSEEELVQNIDINSYVNSWNILHFDGTPFKANEVPLARAVLFGEKCSEEFIVRRDNHEDRIVLAKAAPIKDSNDNITAGIVVFLDITDRIHAHEELEETLKFNQDIITSANCGIIVYDEELRYKVWNPFMERLSGISSKAVIGRKAVEVFPWLKEAGIIENLIGVLKGERIVKRDIYFNIPENGLSGWAIDNSAPLYNKKGEIVGVLGIVQDITERKNAEDNLVYISYHDQLTGAYNRRFFEDEIKRLDTQERLPLSIMMLDVNGLKLVNDSFGHSIGDELLQKTTKILVDASRPDDMIARLGGDEFVIVMPNTDNDTATQIISSIKNLASKQYVMNMEISISIGIDTRETIEQTVLQTLINAENQMYRNKLYERSSNRSKTIDLIMNTLFAKSERESMHSKRVSQICLKIASNMNFKKDELNLIATAGLVHDIGKIGIDENILNKADRLDIYERKQIEKHPETGWRILSSADEFSELAQFILAHHERWDGSGYPNGLKGEEIPVQARIIALADAYDAMTSDRSYRKGLSKEEAILEIRRCTGTQFDPEISEVFVNKVLLSKQ